MGKIEKHKRSKYRYLIISERVANIALNVIGKCNIRFVIDDKCSYTYL